MRPKFAGLFILIIILSCFATGIIIYPNLPVIMISHWNAAGNANAFIGKFWGVFLIPALMLVLSGLWLILPIIDPLVPGYKDFKYSYDFLFFILISFFAYAYSLMLGANLGWQINMIKDITPAVAALFFTIGALLPKIKRNWFVGIRTPWTISSDMVWEKTNSLGSILFEISAIISLMGTFINGKAYIWLVIAPMLISALVCVIYSYIIFHRIGNR